MQVADRDVETGDPNERNRSAGDFEPGVLDAERRMDDGEREVGGRNRDARRARADPVMKRPRERPAGAREDAQIRDRQLQRALRCERPGADVHLRDIERACRDDEAVAEVEPERPARVELLPRESDRDVRNRVGVEVEAERIAEGRKRVRPVELECAARGERISKRLVRAASTVDLDGDVGAVGHEAAEAGERSALDRGLQREPAAVIAEQLVSGGGCDDGQGQTSSSDREVRPRRNPNGETGVRQVVQDRKAERGESCVGEIRRAAGSETGRENRRIED